MSNLASGPRTPTSAPSEISLATPPPTPPSALQPISARARALLRATCNNNGKLSGRTNEAALVQCFIRLFLSASDGDKEHNVLYISGSPGTGKTALVNAVTDGMQAEFTEASAKFVSVNCMALNNVDALWTRLTEVLGDASGPRGNKGKQSPYEALLKLLSSSKFKW